MHDAYRLGPLFIEISSRRVTNGAAEVTLSPRAMGILDVLRRAETRSVSRLDLLDAVWPDVIVTDESLTQAVAEIRRAFQTLGADRNLVVTIPKAGYRLREEPVPCVAGLDGPIATGPAITLDSYCMVLEARTALVRAEDDALEAAVALGREAVGRSPGSALAHATYSIMLVHGALYAAAAKDTLAAALEHAELAVSLAPRSSISHVALGFAIGAPGNGATAFDLLTRGMMLNDRNGEAHYLSARVAFVHGDHRAATTLALQSAECVSDVSRPLFLAARAARHYDPRLSATIARRCVRALERQLADDPDEPRSRHTLGPALGLAGDHERSWTIIAEQPRDRSICSVHDLFGFAYLRDNMRALEALENAIDDGFRDGRWLTREPMLAGFRENRGFQRLTRALETA